MTQNWETKTKRETKDEDEDGEGDGDEDEDGDGEEDIDTQSNDTSSIPPINKSTLLLSQEDIHLVTQKKVPTIKSKDVIRKKKKKKKSEVKKHWEEWSEQPLLDEALKTSENIYSFLKQFDRETIYYMQSEILNLLKRKSPLTDIKRLMNAGKPTSSYEAYSFHKHMNTMSWVEKEKESSISKWLDQCMYKRKGLNTGRKCKHCESTNLDYQQKQTRCSDEALTLIIRCNDCNRLVNKF